LTKFTRNENVLDERFARIAVRRPYAAVMEPRKTIALVAHDNRKRDLIEWVEWNWRVLVRYSLVCTGTTGKLVDAAIRQQLDEHAAAEFAVLRLKSGPLGGDQQLGAMIAEGRIDVVIFFWDPMEPHPHDVDVKALLRIAVVHNIPIACNRSTADFVISSPLLEQPYAPSHDTFAEHVDREIEQLVERS
jgi:methylglyoxal synthase